jgi:hypothetical protein
MDKVLPNPSSVSILETCVFQPFNMMRSDLENVLAKNESDTLKKFNEVRDYLALKLKYLKPTLSNKEMSVREYLKMKEGIFFVSCFNNSDMKKISALIFEYVQLKSTLKIVSNIDIAKYTKNMIINASQLKEFLNTDANIFASHDEIKNWNQLQQVFNSDISGFSKLAKLSGKAQIVGIQRR